MIGTKGLKCTPKSMADMNRRDDHGKRINQYIFWLWKCIRYNLKNGGMGFIHKMKIEQVVNYKQKQNNTSVGHGCRSQGSAAGTFIDGISGGSGFEILIKKEQARRNMDNGKN